MFPVRSIATAAIFFLIASASAQAGPSVVVLAEEYSKPVAIRYKARADYVVQTVTITSSERDLADNLQSIQKAKSNLLDQLSKQKQVVVHDGPTFSYPTKGGLFKSSYGSGQARAQVQVLLPVVRESDTIFSGGAELTRLITKVEAPGKAKFNLSQMRLGVEDPEKMRGLILDMIRQNIEATRQKMNGSGKIIISGLESPVKVSQVDDINVELFIEYNMTIEIN